MKPAVHIFWFRRDLRLHDNAGLFHALRSGIPVVPVFIFDRNILEALENRADSRVSFIHHALMEMQQQLTAAGTTLDVLYGTPLEVYEQLLQDYDVRAVSCNHDQEPYAIKRDEAVEQLLHRSGIPFHHYKDQVIFERDEVLKDDGKPYTVFTPYSKRWKATLHNESYLPFPSEQHTAHFFKQPEKQLPALESFGFSPSSIPFPGKGWKPDLIKHYKEQRDYPAVPGTSRLSVHLRFCTISIRELARTAGSLNETYLNELIWREFYQMILWHFPQVVTKAFKPEYDLIKWRNNEKEFEAWCAGMTGYPIVDAGMRELKATGFMHNRVRMIVASFLTKHLLIDWRWGEAWFAQHLLDFDLASNNGGWQWAAGSGCDAAPYFRVFNPYLQTLKFDPDLKYIRQWVPELDKLTYPRPIVVHEDARKRCLETYAVALKKD